MEYPVKLLKYFGGHKKGEVIYVDYEIYHYLTDTEIGIEIKEDDSVDFERKMTSNE